MKGTTVKGTSTLDFVKEKTVKGRVKAVKETPTYRLPRLLAATVTAVALGGCALNPFHDRGEPAPVANTRAYQNDGLAQAREAFARGNYGIAIGRLQRYLDRHPRSIAALNGLGASFDKLGRYDVARRYYFRALDLNPDAPVTLTNIAYSYILEDRQDEAVPLLELALHYQPDYRHAADNLQLVRTSLARREDPKADDTPTFAMLATLARRENSAAGVADGTATLSITGNAEETPTFAMLATLARRENTAGGVADETPALEIADRTATVKADATSAPVPTLANREPEANETGTAVVIKTSGASHESADATAVSDVTPIFASTRPREEQVADGKLNGTAKESDATAGENSLQPERQLRTSYATFTPEGTLSELRLEVSNGNGVTGMAARTRAWLKQRGGQVVRLTNADSFGYRDTVLYFASGSRREAEVLAALLPLDGVRLEAVDELTGGVDARLRIGHDFVPYDEQISTGGQLAHNTR